MLRNPPSRKTAGLLAAMALGGGLVAAPGTAHALVSTIAWKPCPDKDPIEGAALKGLECGTLSVPLDHFRPDGRRITLALTRARHTSARYQGAVLLNRGGPGAHGRDLPNLFTKALPKNVAASYDWIGFDPRGVGATKPALICDTSYLDPGRPRPDTVPHSWGEELAWRDRAKRYADDCAHKYHDVLPHMGTANWVRDLEAIRIALGQKRINYFGYSYGTYLGAAYATAYPGRVRRMVLDSVVRPSGVWYANNLDQNVAFERRIRTFFTWIARHHDVYGLGRTAGQVERTYYAVRRTLVNKPINGRVGPAELDDIFLSDGYANFRWKSHAKALSDYVVRKDPKPLGKLWKAPSRLGHNTYTMYLATECRDAAWPRTWSTWSADSHRQYREGNRFETWNNTWYNAPCAFWRTMSGPPLKVGGVPGLPGMLLVHATEDAATPYLGAVETHRLFPSSRLLIQRGGGNHGLAMSGDKCVDGAVVAYLDTGALPPGRPGPDQVCKAPPPPEPDARQRPKRPRDKPVEPAPLPANASSQRTS